jgi:hypothetical protein
MNATETTSEALVVANLAGVEISVSQSALDERDRLLKLARAGNGITDGASAARAAEVLKLLKGFSRTIEASRKEAKQPVLVFVADLDGLAKKLTDEIEREAARIAGLIGSWTAEQNRIAEQARRDAWEKEQAIRREAEAKERAEQERLAAEQRTRDEAARAAQKEAEAKANRARTEAGRAKALAEAEAARIKAEADQKAADARALAEGLKRDEQTALAIGAAHAGANAVALAKPQGVSARRDVEFTVEDVHALYEACPVLVKLEPQRAMIKAALKNLSEGQSLPGVKHWFVTGAVVR